MPSKSTFFLLLLIPLFHTGCSESPSMPIGKQNNSSTAVIEIRELNSVDCLAKLAVSKAFLYLSYPSDNNKNLLLGELMAISNSKHNYPEINLIIGLLLEDRDENELAIKYFKKEIELGKNSFNQKIPKESKLLFMASMGNSYLMLEDNSAYFKHKEKYIKYLGSRWHMMARSKREVLLTYNF